MVPSRDDRDNRTNEPSAFDAATRYEVRGVKSGVIAG